MTAIPLGRRLRDASSNLPERLIRTWMWARPAPLLFGLAPGGVCRAVPVARTAVRSYRTVSPLPADGRSLLCGTFPGVTPAGRYPAPYVQGARTFLPGNLSVFAGTAVQPTDTTLGMGSRAAGVKRVDQRAGSPASFRVAGAAFMYACTLPQYRAEVFVRLTA